MRTRFWVGVLGCAAPLLMAGPAVTANPAYAAEAIGPGVADLAVRLDGTTLRNADPEKVVTATIVNRGPAVARNVLLRFDGWVDGEVVNPASVTFCASAGPGQTAVPSLRVTIAGSCALEDLPAGRSLILRATLGGTANAVGTVGRITLAVSQAATDPVPRDNTVTVPLTVAAPSDHKLYARAWDVSVARPGRGAALSPGGTGELRFEVGNRGVDPISGMIVTLSLPGHVRFAETHPGCAYGPDQRTATCTYGDLPLVSSADDTDPADGVHSALWFRHLLAVSAAAPTPARLTGGRLRVVPMTTGSVPSVGAADLPRGVTGLRAGDFRTLVEGDRFVVRTGSRDGDDADGDADADRDGLPVTGAPIGPLVGFGLGAMLVGLAMVLTSRRRVPGARHR